MKTIALVGNQNSGKTTLFNALTGSHQHVGNFPGVTIDKKVGYIKKNHFLQIIDLPGIYSLTPYSLEEKITVDYLIHEKPNMILNIVDASHLERNLYLTLQLKELNIPIIIALNMIDIVKSQGHHIDIELLEKYLNIPVVAISANKKRGLNCLIERLKVAEHKSTDAFPNHDIYDIKNEIYQIDKIIDDKIKILSYPVIYTVIQVIENNDLLIHQLGITQEQIKQIELVINNIEMKTGMSREIIFIEKRYQKIAMICQNVFFKAKDDNEITQSEKIDHFLLHPYLGIPIFIMIMLLIFYLTFDAIGTSLQYFLHEVIKHFSQYMIDILEKSDVSYWLISLIKDGIFLGIGSVLSFLPLIIILFFFLSILEDTGYMARVAFMMDHLLRKIGLSGQSFVPMLLGFGCSVPAIMASRTLSHQKDKMITMILIPFLSCSAKLPVYSIVITAFFPEKAYFAFLFIYLIGIFTVIFVSLLFKIFIFKDSPTTYLLELPTYKLPSLDNILHDIYSKAKDFVKKAFTVILLASLVIWILQNFNCKLEMVKESSQSLLSILGKKMAYFFQPLGFANWQLITALLTGIVAKESIVSTLTLLFHTTNLQLLSRFLNSILSPASALSFITFCALYTPCIASLTTCYRELHSLKKVFIIAFFQTTVAYFMSFFVYHLCLLFL